MDKTVLEEVNKMEAIREKVISDMEDFTNQRYLYTMPYEVLNLTNPISSNEVGVTLENVYVVVKQVEDSMEEIHRKFELYKIDEKDGKSEVEKIAETDSSGKIVPDKDAREITNEIIKLQNVIKQQAENGVALKIAGLNKNGELDAYIRMVDREITVLSSSQKESLDDKSKLNNKKKEEAQKEMDDKEEQRNTIALGMGIDPQDIYQITEIQDKLFYENNDIPGTSGAYAIRKKSGELEIVAPTQDGRYEKCPAFGESTNEMGRTSVMTNDDNKIQEANTYGAVYSKKDDHLRYCFVYGQYGSIEIVEQRRVTGNRSDQTMSDNDTWSPSRKITTDNLAIADKDNKGIGADNDTRIMMNKLTNENYDMNEEAAKIRNHEDPNSLTPEDISDGDVKAESATKKIKEELKGRGIEISADESEKIFKEIKDSGASFCDKDVQDYCDNYEKVRNQDEKSQDEGRSRLDEAFENMQRRRKS